jgi:hypothetical protein
MEPWIQKEIKKRRKGVGCVYSGRRMEIARDAPNTERLQKEPLTPKKAYKMGSQIPKTGVSAR